MSMVLENPSWNRRSTNFMVKIKATRPWLMGQYRGYKSYPYSYEVWTVSPDRDCGATRGCVKLYIVRWNCLKPYYSISSLPYSILKRGSTYRFVLINLILNQSSSDVVFVLVNAFDQQLLALKSIADRSLTFSLYRQTLLLCIRLNIKITKPSFKLKQPAAPK